jgi:hypothetical protein
MCARQQLDYNISFSAVQAKFPPRYFRRVRIVKKNKAIYETAGVLSAVS